MSDTTQENVTRTPGRGSLADLVALAPEEQSPGLPTEAWVKIAVIAVLFAAMHLWQFRDLVGKWLDKPNWSHGFVIPLFSLYLLYNRRHELFSAPRRTCLWGLPIVIVAIVLEFLSFYPIQTYWFANLAMIMLIGGLVLYLAGPRVLKVTWLPIAFLVFAMPIPGTLYLRIALPLQNLAAQWSAVLLNIFGVDITVTASHLRVVSVSGVVHPLVVAEACSGIRSLMAFLALGVAWAYLEYRPVWQRITLVVASVPIVILCNVLRVATTSSMFALDYPELGQKFMHEFMGLLMLIPAAGMLWLLSRILNGLFIEEEDEDPLDPAAEGGVK